MKGYISFFTCLIFLTFIYAVPIYSAESGAGGNDKNLLDNAMKFLGETFSPGGDPSSGGKNMLLVGGTAADKAQNLSDNKNFGSRFVGQTGSGDNIYIANRGPSGGGADGAKGIGSPPTSGGVGAGEQGAGTQIGGDKGLGGRKDPVIGGPGRDLNKDIFKEDVSTRGFNLYLGKRFGFELPTVPGASVGIVDPRSMPPFSWVPTKSITTIGGVGKLCIKTICNPDLGYFNDRGKGPGKFRISGQIFETWSPFSTGGGAGFCIGGKGCVVDWKLPESKLRAVINGVPISIQDVLAGGGAPNINAITLPPGGINLNQIKLDVGLNDLRATTIKVGGPL